MIDEGVLKAEELAVFRLRSIYNKYGYQPYGMSKFEEYELYIKNKSFLTGDRVITFNDTNGKLLALKPDVTLSIIKNTDIPEYEKRKVYYNENVYRVSDSTHRFKEIMQTGLECIGNIDIYDIFEVILLAAESLSVLSDNFIIEVSHLGLLSSVLDSVCSDKIFTEKAISFIKQKNVHDVLRLCDEYGVSAEKQSVLKVLTESYGERHGVIDALKGIMPEEKFSDLTAVSAMFDNCKYDKNIVFDFSLVNDMRYYNGFVFKGYTDGVCDGILAGGQYDGLTRKMGKNYGAVGFAIYLDMIEQKSHRKPCNAVDTVLLYDEYTGSLAVSETVNRLISEGKTVSAQKVLPEKLKYKDVIDLRRA